MKITKLGENLFEVKIPFFYWSTKGHLIKAFLEIQGYGKVITSIYYLRGIWRVSYLVATMEEKDGRQK